MIESCLVGIGVCHGSLIPTVFTGGLIRYFELLSLIGIVFAGVQFLDTSLLRKFLFLRFKNIVIISIGLSLVFLIVSYLLPLIPGKAIIFLGYPYFWKLLSLLFITGVIGFLLSFSMYHNTNLWMIKYNLVHKAKLINEIGYHAIYIDGSEEAYRAFGKILDVNIEKIYEILRLFKREMYLYEIGEFNGGERITDEKQKEIIFEKVLGKHKGKKELIWHALYLFEDILPDNGFCSFLVEKDYNLVYKIYQLAEEKRLWESAGDDFFEELSACLFGNQNSLIKRDMNTIGYYSEKRLFKFIISSPGIIAYYRVIDSDFRFDDHNKKLIIKLCEELLFEYFSRYYSGLAWKVNNLLNRILNPYRFWQSPNEKDIDIELFISNLPRTLFSGKRNYRDEEIHMNYTESETNLTEYSVIGTMTDLLFQDFELILRKDEKGWYFDSQSYWWIIWNDKSIYNTTNKSKEVLENIRKYFLKKIIDRIDKEEKNQGFYDNSQSIIKLLLTIFGWKMNNSEFTEDQIIPKWTEDQFNNKWGTKFLEDEIFRKKHLPIGLSVRDGKIIDIAHEDNNQIFPKA